MKLINPPITPSSQPDNILLQSSGSDSPDDGLNVKLSDFGLVAFSDNAMMIENKAGTPFYMGMGCAAWVQVDDARSHLHLLVTAPEVLNGNGYSQQCDVWSIGIIAFLL